VSSVNAAEWCPRNRWTCFAFQPARKSAVARVVSERVETGPGDAGGARRGLEHPAVEVAAIERTAGPRREYELLVAGALCCLATLPERPRDAGGDRDLPPPVAALRRGEHAGVVRAPDEHTPTPEIDVLPAEREHL
jgi:hypothetical protein